MCIDAVSYEAVNLKNQSGVAMAKEAEHKQNDHNHKFATPTYSF